MPSRLLFLLEAVKRNHHTRPYASRPGWTSIMPGPPLPPTPLGAAAVPSLCTAKVMVEVRVLRGEGGGRSERYRSRSWIKTASLLSA